MGHPSNPQPISPAGESEPFAPNLVTPDTAAGYLQLVLADRAKMAERLHRIAVAWSRVETAQRIEVDRVLGERLTDELLDVEAWDRERVA